jgi:uncharacterized membrane protein
MDMAPMRNVGLRLASLGGLAVAGVGAALAWPRIRGSVSRALGLARGGNGRTIGNLGVKIDREVIVAAPRERLYFFWRNFTNLPRIMSHVERVELLSPTRSRWWVKAPAGLTFEWEAEIFNDLAWELIAWRTLPGAAVTHAGSVRFAPAGEGRTRVAISLQYDPPGGALADAVAGLFGADAGSSIQHDLERFREAVESGRLAA